MSTDDGSDPSWQPEAERQIPHKREPLGNHLHLFFIAIIRAPLPGLSTSLCDRPHVLSESQGRYVAGSEPNSTVRCTDKENKLATMNHRDTDICVSLRALCTFGILQNFKHREYVIKNAADINYHTNLHCQFSLTVY